MKKIKKFFLKNYCTKKYLLYNDDVQVIKSVRSCRASQLKIKNNSMRNH